MSIILETKDIPPDLLEYFEPVIETKKDVWTVSTQPFSEAHFATFPPQLIQPCILAGCPEGGTVLDPFFGAGTTGYVCEKYGRRWAGIELNESYAEIAKKRIEREAKQLKIV